MTTEEQAHDILAIIQNSQACIRALNCAVLALNERITALETRLAELRADAVLVVH